MQKNNLYKIPSSGEAREELRKSGQFWTPDWVAEAMVAYVLGDKGGQLFDPAVGAGAFFRAAKTIAIEKGFSVHFSGMDIDPLTLEKAINQGLDYIDLKDVRIGDFICQYPQEKLFSIVANPPYIRHHRLTKEIKEKLKQLSLETIGYFLDGRAGLHIYFLIRALTLLQKNGRLAFIMPADTCEGKFSNDLWRWISRNYALDAVITFSPMASPFPKVDTNPLIFMISNHSPKENFYWIRCEESQAEMLKKLVDSNFQATLLKGLTVTKRKLSEGISTGLSRPATTGEKSKYVLGDFAKVMRGVATGANEFFFLNSEQVRQTNIPITYFKRAVGRTRDVSTTEITQDTLDELDEKGRPTFLLALNGDSLEKYPDSLKAYLKRGEMLGLSDKPLISQRKPWYKMETRIAPPFLFAYLGRRNIRFIRNTARIIPLTSFLCVYPKSIHDEDNTRLWNILNHPETIANLVTIGKSYGDGAVKVEPRSLEKLPIPENVIKQLEMKVQLSLFENTNNYRT